MPSKKHLALSVLTVAMLAVLIGPRSSFSQALIGTGVADTGASFRQLLATEIDTTDSGYFGTSYRSLVDKEDYDVEGDSRTIIISQDSMLVAQIPADLFARVGKHFHEMSFAPNSSTAGLFVDPDAGLFSVSLKGKIIDIVLGTLTVLFALAFLVTGYFLLRTARERRVMHEGRIRQLRAREAERTHLAAELHDGPVQDLQFVMRSYFGLRPVASTGATPELSEIQSRLENVSAALRNICTELRPPVLAHFGLAYAIRRYAEKYQHRIPHTTINIDVPGEETVESEELSLALYRIFQESLSNIEKHSMATNVWVELQIDSDWAELVIRDDGKGFVLPKSLDQLEADGHLGLAGLSQRAEAVGGVFEVRSSPGVGTTIRAVAKRLAPQEDGSVSEPARAL